MAKKQFNIGDVATYKGVVVQIVGKISGRTYRISYQGKEVIVNLNELS